ncbi:YhgE/Pip domain-containing protein [Clostridium sartagoforme]|uniref:YhgE/Pip domain-containing protein n=1 Tax=Clostridium sartagoforme TaxID=84031 RepID=UPI0003A88BC8|nr:YhgE/Pip domain-containing protein [Clostridium sartagoforme]
MNFLKIAREDIKSIFKNRFIRVSIIAIIIVPLLYSLLYLYAFWDPYAKLEDVHIAVVNKDEGATLDGSKVNYGKDIEEELKGNHEIGWEITSEENANEGLEGKGYYAKVVIPEDFSSKIIAAKEGAPKVAKIDFISNDKKNFLASQINSKVEQELNAKITKTISQNYVEVAFDSLYEAKDGLTQAADGSKQIYDGMNTLNEKVPTLAEGATKLSDGSSQLLDGQATLNNGISSIINGANALNSGLGQVYEKVPTLSSGVSALANGTNELKSGTSEALAGSK